MQRLFSDDFDESPPGGTILSERRGKMIVTREYVMSSWNGVVEEVAIQEDEKIYEWEKLFTIRTDDGEQKTVAVGICGKVESIEVQKGDRVVPGMVLAFVVEEIYARAAD
jgi:pyruvate carboxylase